MGNADLIFIFNDTKIIEILGTKYDNRKQAIKMAIEEYYKWAKSRVQFEKTLETINPSSTPPEMYYMIDSIKIYEN